MSDFKGILRLTRTQFNTLKQNGTLTVGSKVITYDPLTTFYTSLDDMFLSDYLDLTTNQTINGQKKFSDVLKVNGNLTTDNAVDLGTTSKKFGNIYANTFVGNLEGNVTGNVTGNLTGVVTGSMSKKLILQTGASTTSNYNGSTDVTLSNYYVDRFTAQTINGSKTFVNNATFNGAVVIGGNLTVSGTTTTVDSTTLKVKDKLIEVAKDNTAALTTPAGLLAPKYDGVNYGALGFDSTGTAYVGDVVINSNGDIDVSSSSTTWQPIATRAPASSMVGYGLTYWDSTNSRLLTTAAGTSGQILKSNGTSAPTWITPSTSLTAYNVSQSLTLQTGASSTSTYNGSVARTLSTYYVDRFTAQTIAGTKTFTDTTTKLNQILVFTDTSNPYIQMTTSSTSYYVQSSSGKLYVGPTFNKATYWDSTGLITMPIGAVVGGLVKPSTSDSISLGHKSGSRFQQVVANEHVVTKNGSTEGWKISTDSNGTLNFVFE